MLSQFLSRRTNPFFATDPKKRLEFPLRVLKAICREAHKERESYIAVLVKFNVSEATDEDLPLSDVCFFAKEFYSSGADLLVPSGGHVMINGNYTFSANNICIHVVLGLHMLRGGRPLEAMAASQQNMFKKFVISAFGKYFVKKEEYRESFFRETVISVMISSGIPFSHVCLIGGVQDVQSAENAVAKDGFAAVQLGRVLLADPDWCIKIGAYVPNSGSCIKTPLQICDRSNQCIVGATMALTPLKCTKYKSDDW